jgi:hypothetical protein
MGLCGAEHVPCDRMDFQRPCLSVFYGAGLGKRGLARCCVLDDCGARRMCVPWLLAGKGDVQRDVTANPSSTLSSYRCMHACSG